MSSNVLHVRMEGLVKKGLLCVRTVANQWIIPGGEDVPASLDGYVRGLVTPRHRFLRGLLHYYGLELQHLNPNGI